MRKLLLSSVSVMAFATAATQAAVQPQELPAAELVKSAQQAISLDDIIPANQVATLVREQAVTTLAEESQLRLAKGLFAMNEKKATEARKERSE
ncbi:hypothetical protein [Alteromonas antoniana]|uniref:hypothetical protein n=1 Tax=Alteromonas antoniana TaxID=2803813 RepID=UPI001C44194B|nr:hypothetical protein [Alteromonas antoniana]